MALIKFHEQKFFTHPDRQINILGCLQSHVGPHQIQVNLKSKGDSFKVNGV